MIYSKKSGFTLIELLIVIVIIGIAFLSVILKVSRGVSNKDRIVKELDNILHSAYKKARFTGMPVSIKVVISKSVIFEGNRKILLPNNLTVTSVEVNNKKQVDDIYWIEVYPCGISDYFKLTLSNGYIYESVPIFLKVKREK